MKRSSCTRLAAIALVSTTSAVSLVLAACEAATNLDVHYADAGALVDGVADGVSEAAEGGSDPSIVPGCPCDEAAGLGCCVPVTGLAFCTAEATSCTRASGTYLKCLRPDPSTESACCWRPNAAAGSTTALAASCAGGLTACSDDTDCAGTGEACAKAPCAGGTVVIGACAKTPPVCPRP